MAERDPRVDPRPGDVIMVGPYGDKYEFTITRVEDDRVFMVKGAAVIHRSRSPSSFRSWAKTATIIKRGDS
jgi:hypothetical protein